MAYTKVGWKDYPDTTTPINAKNLNQMDQGIADNASSITTQSEQIADVQSDISQINTDLTALNKSLANLILDKLYPIGSIYLETTNTNPSTKLGGTWVAYGSSDTYLRLGGNGSGGSNTITTSNLPAHTHGLNGHTHSIPALSGTAASAGSHVHNSKNHYTANNGDGTTGGGISVMAGTSASIFFTDLYRISYSTGAHTHSVTTTASTTGANSGSTGSTGSGTEFNPKYVQVYAWKRTA